MKIRQKFESYNFILLAAPICIIGVVSVLFVIIFVMKFPIEEIQITRTALLNPVIFMRALGTFFTNHPAAVTYLIVYAAICLTTCIVTSTILTRRLAMSLERPISELRKNIDKIRNDELSFEVMGSDYDELDDLCEGFDLMRRELLLFREREASLKHERNMLIANISHDLKTPITSIKGYIDGINDGIADTPEKLKKYLSTIKAKAETIDELVSNLSIFAKLEISGLRFDMHEGDLRDLLYDVLDFFCIDFERCGLKPVTDITETPLIVNIDGEKLRRVLINIIDNAIKYRRTESRTIEIKCFADEGSAYIIIKDDGMGIAQNELPKVFDSFYRTDSSRTSQVKGNGLGLGIAKQITEKHKGRLWLRSDGINKGTTATISLPLVS